MIYALNGVLDQSSLTPLMCEVVGKIEQILVGGGLESRLGHDCAFRVEKHCVEKATQCVSLDASIADRLEQSAMEA